MKEGRDAWRGDTCCAPGAALTADLDADGTDDGCTDDCCADRR
jgi:hypothetical protein